MLPSWCRETVVVRRAPLVESRGSTRRDWAHASKFAVDGCMLQRGETQTTFGASGRDPAESGATLFCPPDADIREGDRVDADGGKWLVSGIPSPRVPGFTCDHLSVSLRQWKG